MTFASDVDISTRHLLITQRLRNRRDELGLTQKQVVSRLGRCGLRTTNRALSSLEHGTGLDVAKLPELAAALDCTVTYLIGLTDDPRRWDPDDELAIPQRGVAKAVVQSPPEPRTPRALSASLILGADVPDRAFSPRSSTRR